jgi:glycosyl transferase, family 25
MNLALRSPQKIVSLDCSASMQENRVRIDHCTSFGSAIVKDRPQKMPSETAIRVISLDESTQRRAEFSRQVSGFELDWSFFSAYKRITSPLAYNDRDATRRFGRPLFPPEIGAYVSHFKCWEWLAESEHEQIIILEDDILADWRAITQLSQFKLSDYRIELLRLFATHPIKCRIVMHRFLAPHCHLVRAIGMYLGMQGYMLTKIGARRLVETYSNIAAPIDWVLTRYWEHGLQNYSLFPFPVIEQHVASTIGARGAVTEPALFDRAVRLCWRIRDRAKREYFDRATERWPLGPTVDAGPVFIDRAAKSR